MIKQSFTVENYWEVIVYYDVDYHFFDSIYLDLKSNGATEANINTIYDELHEGKAKAVTFNSYTHHTSIVLFSKHKSSEDYINSIVHEATHIMQALMKAYNIKNTDEPPAYTIGYLVMRMYEVFKKLICN